VRCTCARTSWTVRLDEWLTGEHLQDTIECLTCAQDDKLPDAVSEQARREIAACDAKLRQHRAAHEAGADPAIIARWITETQARRSEAEARLRPEARRQPMTPDQIAARLAQIGDIPAVLAGAALQDRAELYSQLGLTMTYEGVSYRLCK
jgi:hypothetical protein